MVFDHIETLKREYTDKYVVVDNSFPELRRFDGQTGLIKTVNMNGRALVEFDGLANIGWYDIDLDFLKVVDKPLPKVEPKKKDAPKKAAKPISRKEDAPAKTAPAAKMSVAEMLAAARGEKTGSAPKAEAAAAAKPSTADAPAPKKEAGKMSVAEMLAAARAEKSGSAPPTAEPAEEAPTAELEPEAVAPEPAEEAAPVAQGELPTDVAGICVYCRQHDGR